MNRKIIDRHINQSLKEDAAHADITTTLLIPKFQTSKAYIVAKQDCIICGLTIAQKIFKKIDKNLRFSPRYKDGQKVTKNSRIASLQGKTRALLTGERVALNFLGYLSGISTHTNTFVKKIRPYSAKILDTRKTTPGNRALEKYAVKCGGGWNHRKNLKDMVLIKDNHRLAMHSKLTIQEAIHRTKKMSRKTVEVEVDNLKELRQALQGRPNMILLDNMNAKQIKKAVALTKSQQRSKNIRLEVSGGVHINNVRSIAKAGVHRISIGAITHSAPHIDFSMVLVA